MKLAGARAAAFCSKPDPALTGALIYGPDPGLVALRRRELIAALTEGEDMRLTRIEPMDAQKDPAGIDAALRAQGFFPGRRAVLIERARRMGWPSPWTRSWPGLTQTTRFWC